MSATGELSFFQSLAIQGRVLHALMMRELITRFGRDNLGVLWLVGEPMIFTLGVTTLWSAAGLSHGGTGLPIVAFAVTGYSSVLMWRNAATRCSAAIEQNKPLLFHRSVLIIDVFLTRIALEVIGATSSFIILSLFFGFIGWMPAPHDLLVVLARLVHVGLAGCEYGVAGRRGYRVFTSCPPAMASDILFAVSHVRRRLHGRLAPEAPSRRCPIIADGSRRRTASPRLFWQCRADALRHWLYGRVLFGTDTVRLVCRA